MKKFVQVLAMLFLCVAALPAQATGGEGHPNHDFAEQGHQDHAHDGHAATPTMEMSNGDFFKKQYAHLMPHALGVAHGEKHERGPFTFYDMNLFQLFAVGLMLLIFGWVKVSFASGSNNWLVRVFRGWVHWLRDELVYGVMGEEEGKQFAPFFVFLFFFIAFLNLLGLIPVVGVTATASFYVTGTLALIIFAMMLGFGFMKQGVFGFFKNLLPHGLPILLIPLMIVVELVGLIIKPFALMVRLFANMLAGHMVIYSFIGMIFLFAKMFELGPASYGTAVASVGMAVFINIIEAFIALLQAYIFTYLSVIFLQQSMHPAH